MILWPKLLSSRKPWSAFDTNLKDEDQFGPTWAQPHLVPYSWVVGSFTFKKRKFDDTATINLCGSFFLAYHNSPKCQSILFFAESPHLVLLNLQKFIQLRESCIYETVISSAKWTRRCSPNWDQLPTAPRNLSRSHDLRIGRDHDGHAVDFVTDSWILHSLSATASCLIISKEKIWRQTDWLQILTVSYYLWILSKSFNLPELQFLPL